MEREYPFSERDFALIRQLVSEHAGIVLNDAKKDMVYSRLVRRLRALGLASFKDYCDLLIAGDDQEFVNFINSITTNLTAFFREPHHFEFLRKQALPELMAARAGQRRLRIWSSGCSTGEEPYTLAMTIHEHMAQSRNWDVKILATDLDSNVLEVAKAGLYGEERIRGLQPERVKRFFLRGTGAQAGTVRVRPQLQEFITFKQLNLMGDWPMRGPFDVIFCRNVVIYFDKDTQRRLFDRYADILADDGYLVIGHSETLYKVSDRFELIGNTVYRKASEC